MNERSTYRAFESLDPTIGQLQSQKGRTVFQRPQTHTEENTRMNNFSLFFAVAFVVLFIIGAIWLTQLE